MNAGVIVVLAICGVLFFFNNRDIFQKLSGTALYGFALIGLVLFGLCYAGWHFWQNPPSSREKLQQPQTTQTTVSAAYSLGASDARGNYGLSDMETALRTAKLVRRITADSEYEQGFRDEWRHLDNKPALDYQRAKGQ
jgi:hypothetical protein